MKVIFLDNDGVCCLPSEFGSRFKRGTTFDHLNKKAVSVLNEILTITDAELVISSDWRLLATLSQLQEMYIEQGLIKAPIDVTPRFIPRTMSEFRSPNLESNRVWEIKSWISIHPEVTKWVAIDDLDLSALGQEHFVHCTRINEGIKQSGIKDKIIDLLKDS